MDLNQALGILLQIVSQTNLNIAGKDIPVVNEAIMVLQNHLQSQASSTTPISEVEVEEADAA
jgi:hypothetical protein